MNYNLYNYKRNINNQNYGYLFLGKCDYANILYNWYNSIKTCKKNIDVYYSLLVDSNPYNYNRSGKIKISNFYDKNLINNLILFCKKKNIKHIIIEELFYRFTKEEIETILKIINNLNYIGCSIYWFHNGTKYRNNYKKINYILSKLKIKKIIYGADLYRLSNFNNKIIILPTYYYKYDKNMLYEKFNNDKIIILHCPSKNKGSDIIEAIVNSVIEKYENVEFKIVNKVKHDEIMKNKELSHIYIDQFCDGNNGRTNVGGFGVSSIEALSTGNIVLSLNNNIPYKYFENGFPIIDLKCEEHFVKILNNLLQLSIEELKKKAIESFDYFNKYISYNATSNKIIQLCNV